MSRVLRDGIIGISDGLTIPFILAAGLCGAGAEHNTIVVVCLAGILIGALSMGLGGFFAFKAEVEHLDELKSPEPRIEEDRTALTNLGLDEKTQLLMEAERMKDQEKWQSFQSQFEIAELQADSKNSFQRAFLIFTTYLLGGLIPIAPFLFLNEHIVALTYSGILTGTALLCFGFYKSRSAGKDAILGAFRQGLMAFAGAAAAYLIAGLFVDS